MTAPAQALRKLAEEIAVNEQPDLYPLDTHAEKRDRWEARLRSTLPELSQVLGELAVMREALETASRSLRTGLDRAEAEGVRGPLRPAALAAESDLRSALSSDLGRLAGEALRAAVEFRFRSQVHHQATRLPPSGGSVDTEDAAYRHKRAAQTQFRISVDALLAACFGLRKEVGR